MQTKLKSSRYFSVGIVIVTISFLGYLYFRAVGFFGINDSSCIDGNYFYISRLDRQVKDGYYVAFKFKGSDRYRKNYIFIKIVGCTSGQRLISRQTKNGYGYFCGNRLLGYACNRLINPTCPRHVEYNEIIPKGYFYAMGTAWDAYDSRYWGLASEKSVIGRGFLIKGLWNVKRRYCFQK